MFRILALLGVTVLLMASAACGGAKPPAPAAVQGNKIISSLQDLSRMYEKRNHPAFMSLISDKFKERQSFSSSIESVFSKHEAVHFTIQYANMFIMVEDRGMTRATFNWNSEWRTAGGSRLKNSGRATFIFDPDDAKLVSIDGKNPFIPQAVESQGKQ